MKSISVITLAAGLAALAAAEFAGIAALHIVAAALLAAGAVGAGIAVAYGAWPAALAHIPRHCPRIEVCVAAGFLVAPVVLTLVAALAGASVALARAEVSAPLIVAGAAIALALLGAAIIALWLALRALRGEARAPAGKSP